ncbi:hypothetical protein DFH06DRAFT_1483794 [Mycena polygramma]|nr:hypothetical protein DFH06DRAFT_1483794 [Mycena polygramma]
MKFTISLLALCGAACALTVSQTFPPAKIDKVVDAAVYISGNATSVETDKRTQGNVYLCTAAFFSGYCVEITGGFSGGCIDLAVDLDNQVSSFGPDQGQLCELFNAHNCQNDGAGTPAWTGPIGYPGVQDLSKSFIDNNGNVNAPFNDIISSYLCNFV